MISVSSLWGGIQRIVLRLASGIPDRAVGHLRVGSITWLVLLCGSLSGWIGPASARAEGALPDNRVYEMVTPADNQDAEVYIPEAFERFFNEGIHTRLPFQVAESGEAVAYVASPTSAGFGQSGSGLGNEYLARRQPDGRWVQTVAQPAARKQNNYQGFSGDLSVGVLNSGISGEPNVPPIAAGAPGEGYSVLYKCVAAAGWCTAPTSSDPQPAVPFEPLFGKPLYRSAKEFGTNKILVAGKIGRVPALAGGSSDFSTLAFEADDALISGSGRLETELAEDVEKEIQAGELNSYLYAQTNGTLNLVDVLPNGKVAPEATYGAPVFEKPEDNAPGFGGVVSPDGSRMLWTDLAPGIYEHHVFVRENPSQPESPLGPENECLVPSDACTVAVSEGAARYWASGDDGRYVFYEENGGLYRFDDETDERETLAAAGGGVFGVLGASEDGESAYFTAGGVLGGASSSGQSPVAGAPNLYLWRHGGSPVFVARLSREDGEEADPYGTPAALNEVATGLRVGDWQPGLGQRTAAVGGGGGSLVFMSNQSLPVVGFPGGYRNGGLDEVYLFEAGVDRLFCVSCSSSGAAPPSSSYVAPPDSFLGAAAFLPISWSDTARPEWLSSDGNRVFFDSVVPLVPQDTNNKVDVYEWEREGTGGCEASVAVNGGCVYLLSGGSSTSGSWLVGASASGDDVFMVTRAQLVPGDGNDADDLYDARVGGVVPVSPPACTGTGCQGVPAPPPTFATPSSVTFEGPGNFAPVAPAPVVPKAAVKKKTVRCAKGKHLSHGRCTKQAARPRRGKRASFSRAGDDRRKG